MEKMSHILSYLKIHLKIITFISDYLILKTDKRLFAFLFNLRSICLFRSPRLRWKGNYFVITDKSLPSFSHKIRHQRQCNLTFKFGWEARAESLGKVYFLEKINFKDGDIVIDCGANVGDLKLWFEFKNIKIDYVGFEPSPIEFKCLKANVHPSTVHNVGLWNSDDEIKFYLSSQGADSSLIKPPTYASVAVTKTFRLEGFLSEPVKCLKLEAEGAEPEVLEGLGDKLQYVEYIAADLGFERGVSEESTLTSVTNFLLSNGFELIDISHDRICALFHNVRT
ncbi:FkbM family methyltransferase [Planktomarina temperata]|nr:FkbM family methyltransferase [Planktomarina temperata]